MPAAHSNSISSPDSIPASGCSAAGAGAGAGAGGGDACGPAPGRGGSCPDPPAAATRLGAAALCVWALLLVNLVRGRSSSSPSSSSSTSAVLCPDLRLSVVVPDAADARAARRDTPSLGRLAPLRLLLSLKPSLGRLLLCRELDIIGRSPSSLSPLWSPPPPPCDCRCLTLDQRADTGRARDRCLPLPSPPSPPILSRSPPSLSSPPLMLVRMVTRGLMAEPADDRLSPPRPPTVRWLRTDVKLFMRDSDFRRLRTADSGSISVRSDSPPAPSPSLGTHRYVCIMPLPLTCTPPVLSQSSWGSRRANASDTCTQPGRQVDSMRDAVLMVSPNNVNLGILAPTSPLTSGPVWMPMRSCTGSLLCGMSTGRDSRSIALANCMMRTALLITWSSSISSTHTNPSWSSLMRPATTM
mmetsp:Transcript_13491/g.33073  ORF Transcript_13491/g.33073 Transcript_13491/m.33073 type:complete len:412 (-) Transcript_13491:596-1831(-)